MQNQSLNLSTCFTNEPPFDQSDYLVIYSKEKQDVEFHREILYQGYIEAADIIVDKLYSEKISPDKDTLALPLLNLYVNTIEFILKLFIKDLNDHRELRCCITIGNPGEDKKLSHDLSFYLNKILKMLPDKGKLHEFVEFQEISEFIEDMYKFNMTTESTRYILDKNDNIYPLHREQSWINFKLLHENIKKQLNLVLRYP